MIYFAPARLVCPDGLMRGAEDAAGPDPALHGVVKHDAASLARASHRVGHGRRARRARLELVAGKRTVMILVIPGVAPVRHRSIPLPRVRARRGDHHHRAGVPRDIAEVPRRVLRHDRITGTRESCSLARRASGVTSHAARQKPTSPQIDIRSPGGPKKPRVRMRWQIFAQH